MLSEAERNQLLAYLVGLMGRHRAPAAAEDLAVQIVATFGVRVARG